MANEGVVKVTNHFLRFVCEQILCCIGERFARKLERASKFDAFGGNGVDWFPFIHEEHFSPTKSVTNELPFVWEVMHIYYESFTFP